MGDDRSGHISAGANEGILFFDSQFECFFLFSLSCVFWLAITFSFGGRILAAWKEMRRLECCCLCLLSLFLWYLESHEYESS